MSKRQAQAKLNNAFSAKADRTRYQHAVLGHPDGTVYITDRPGYVWARLGGANGQIIQLYARGLLAGYNMPVVIHRLPHRPQDYGIVDLDTSAWPSQASGDTSGGWDGSAYIGKHGSQHWYYGGDAVLVHLRAFTPLRVYAAGSMVIGVQPGIIPRAGVDLNIVNQTLDLTNAVPASAGYSRYVLISLDADGVLTETRGTLVSGILGLDLAYVPETPAGHFRLAAVRTYHGQTSINEGATNTDIVDLRWPQERMAGEETAITALTGDVTATGPGSVAATLATVNASPGTFGSATEVAQVTVNAKGLATTVSAVTISGVTPAAHDITGALHTTSGRTAGQIIQATGATAFGWSTNTLTLSGNSTINGSLVGNMTGGGTVETGGFTGTLPKTGTLPVGTGTAGRITEWVTDSNTLRASTLVKSGAGVLTLSSAGAYTLTVPATGTAALGTGASTRVAFWSGTNTLSSSANLIWDNTNNYLGIGGSPFANLTVIGSGGFFIASTVAASANKVATITTARYTSGLVSMFSADISSTNHIVNYGGGLGGNYAATRTRFYTAADVNTTVGSVAMSIDSSQNVGIGIDPASYRLHVLLDNSTTAAVDTVACIGHNSTGTATTGFGARQLWQLKAADTASQNAAAIDVSWATATFASRKARLLGKLWDTAERTWLQVDTDGSTTDVLINSLIYGSFYMDDGAQAVTATLANTYYEVGGGMTTSLVNGMTFQNSKELLVTVAGTYQVDWSMSVSNSVSDNTVAGAVMVNTTEKHVTENATRAKENGITYSIGGTGIIALAVNDVVKLCVENETAAGSTITVNHANLSVVRIGE